jgi:non-ribosomal peptide synthase protein (TIGR01720 family)
VVLARTDSVGGQRLVAYVVADDAVEPSREHLRQHMQHALPEYMIPAAFVVLEAWPLTPSGKIDRNALPEPVAATPDSTTIPETEIEHTLAAIWQEVLGLSVVGIHDNFFELGGDSILSIQIVARAAQAGLYLAPKDIFQSPTIAQQAKVAKTTVTYVAEQGIVTGELPLTPIQHWFFAQQFAEQHHWNQALLLAVRTPLDEATLRDTVAQIVSHHDALRIRFVPTAQGWQQVNADDSDALPFHWIDLTGIAPDKQSATLTKHASELQASLDLTQGPVLRVAYFNLGNEQPGHLLLIVHHLVIDGISWRILLEDLQNVYQHVQRGEPVQLPPKTTAFRDWARRLLEYAQTAQVRSEADYWIRRMPNERDIGRLPMDHPHGYNDIASEQSVTMSLSQDETRVLLQQVPRAYGTEINEVLLAALALALTRWSGKQAVLVDVEGHGRENIGDDIDVSRTVGWLTSVYPVLLSLRKQSMPEDALKTIKEAVRQVPARGIGYGLLRYLTDDQAIADQMTTLPSAAVSFNYLGQTDQTFNEDGLFMLATDDIGPSRSPRAQRDYVLEIDGSIIGDQLHLEWSYSANQYQRQTIADAVDLYREAIQSIIAHCQDAEAGGYTPSDFPLANLDQKKLDKLMNKANRTKRTKGKTSK